MKIKFGKYPQKSGAATIDIVFAVAIATISLVAMVSLVTFSGRAFEQSINQNKATFLAQEGLEGAYLVGRNNFDALSTPAEKNAILYNASTSVWAIESCVGNQKCMINNFERTIEVTEIDGENKKITITIAWPVDKILKYEGLASKYNLGCENSPCPSI